MSISSLRNAVNWALMVALVLGTGAMARANEERTEDGKVVRIGQSDDAKTNPKLPAPDDGSGNRENAPPKYWIGLLGGSIPSEDALRAHLDLPEDQGLRVENVVPDSPAAKAGLKRHDILLRANDQELHEMHDLVDMVATEGAKKGQITLEVLRKNKRETVYLTPEERPANAPVPQGVGGGFGGGFGGGQAGLPNELMQQFGGNFPMEFRNFGNGMILHGDGGGAAEMPNGVSVNVQKQDGKPAQITVKRGDETWTVTDDPESLKQLPEDLRPFVEGMLHGNRRMQFRMPNIERGPGGPGINDGRLRERMERLEQRLEEMQKRFGEQPNDKDTK